MTTCKDMDETLNDYLDDLLTAPARRTVEQHLPGCEHCRESLRALRSLRDQTAALPRALEPGRDLWPGIEQALPRRGSMIGAPAGGARWPLAPAWTAGLAAAAVILVVATVAITGLLTHRVPSPQDGRAAGAAAAPSPGSATLTSFRQVETGYLRATDDLLGALKARRGEMSPATLAVIDKNLDIINQAIREMRTAVEADPNRSADRRLFTALHEKKVELLQQAIRLSMQSRKETRS